jgi:RNA polymerase sigma-70 factor (ECF subfamily)
MVTGREGAAVPVGRPAGGAGPEARFRALYADHAEAVLGYALRRVATPGDAGDVVADVFLVAWRRLDDLPAEGEARPWLFGVARRVLANRRRGDERRSRLGHRLRTHVERSLADDAGVGADDVRSALDRLPEEDREILRLTAWEQLTPGEIAVAYGIPAATARTRLHRARGRLRRELGDRPALSGGGGDR